MGPVTKRKAVCSTNANEVKALALTKVINARNSDFRLPSREVERRWARIFGLNTHLVCIGVCTAQSDNCAQYARRVFLKSLRS